MDKPNSLLNLFAYDLRVFFKTPFLLVLESIPAFYPAVASFPGFLLSIIFLKFSNRSVL